MNTNCEMGRKWEEEVGKIYRLSLLGDPGVSK